jgi:hypothetical protein
MNSYQIWWDTEGSAMRPLPNEDMEEFARRITAIAWSNCEFVERNRIWTQDHWTDYERSIAATEREACVKVCEDMAKGYEERNAWPEENRDINPEVARIASMTCAFVEDAIRARGK